MAEGGGGNGVCGAGGWAGDVAGGERGDGGGLPERTAGVVLSGGDDDRWKRGAGVPAGAVPLGAERRGCAADGRSAVFARRFAGQRGTGCLLVGRDGIDAASAAFCEAADGAGGGAVWAGGAGAAGSVWAVRGRAGAGGGAL